MKSEEEDFIMINIKNNGQYIKENGDEEWYKDGKLHRENGPAVIVNNRNWYLNDKITLKCEGQIKYWYQHGKLHRNNGPAIIYPNGQEEYYIEGKKYTKKEFLEYLDIEKNFSSFIDFSYFKNLFC